MGWFTEPYPGYNESTGFASLWIPQLTTTVMFIKEKMVPHTILERVEVVEHLLQVEE